MANKSSDKMSYGITFLIFGLLFLFQKLGLLSHIPFGDRLVSIGGFFLITSIVFLATQPKKMVSWVLLAIAILLNADFFFGWVSGFSYLIVPIGLTVAGLVMILSASRK